MNNTRESSAFKAKYVTMGCKLNFAETASIGQALKLIGISEAADDDQPDFIIVNTCSVTAVADRKCRQTIRSLARTYPEATIVVTGCYAQLKPEEAKSLEGVHIVVSNNDKNRLSNILEQWIKGEYKSPAIEKASTFERFEPSCSRGNRTRYFLKVQDGCNYYCSYCAIPYARGMSRSPEIEDLVQQARGVAREGGKEIVLTGVNIGDFGWKKKNKFIDLIKKLDDVEGIERFRISSIEPNLLTEDIINFVVGSRAFMPHFHIPLQSGDDEVLRLMRRRYDTGLFAERIKMIRELLPDAFIGVDLIVGMRGETPQLFDNSYEFVNAQDISRLHVFPYSEREGTAALSITPIVAQADKQKRTKMMLDLSARKEKEFSQRFDGQIRPVLIENFDGIKGVATGHTDNYIKVKVKNVGAEITNSVVPVKLGTVLPERGEGFYSQGEIIQ